MSFDDMMSSVHEALGTGGTHRSGASGSQMRGDKAHPVVITPVFGSNGRAVQVVPRLTPGWPRLVSTCPWRCRARSQRHPQRRLWWDNTRVQSIKHINSLCNLSICPIILEPTLCQANPMTTPKQRGYRWKGEHLHSLAPSHTASDISRPYQGTTPGPKT